MHAMTSTMSTDETFGALLRRLRIEAGMKQDDLALRLGVTTASVSYWENDKHPPSYVAVKELAEIFGDPTLLERAGFPTTEYDSIHSQLRAQAEAIAELRQIVADLVKRLGD